MPGTCMRTINASMARSSTSSGFSDLAKWLEVVGYSLLNHPDPELERLADQVLPTFRRASSPMVTSTASSPSSNRT